MRNRPGSPGPKIAAGRRIVDFSPRRQIIEHQRLRVVLGLLVIVRRADRRVLGGGRMLDVAVNAAGAAVHELAHAGIERRLQHDARALDVDFAIVTARHVHFSERRRDMMHYVGARDAAPDGLRVGDGSKHESCAPVRAISSVR